MNDSDSKSATENFRRVAELFEAARAIPAARREAILAESGESYEILEEVRRLLTAHDDDTALLDTPIMPQVALAADELMERETALPEQIGPFRILRQIAAGGMGAVYLAEQDNPRRNVAVKVIRPGLASRELQRRFELEATVLGRLQHPGIAQIHEAGLYDDGAVSRPYFAMEFVNGIPLNEFVRQYNLTVNDRLRMFIEICDAVHHAHQRGVIHRDLKPSNIVVNKEGEPKILDFGVARATDSDLQATTHATNIGQLIGTLPYMSPEQAIGRAHDVDTRSDVYALGVIVYELLADRFPYDLSRATIVTAARTIAESDPTPLSFIRKGFRGDLNTIVLKALEKQPAERYQSAAEFSADVRRFLANEPIVARPQTTWYQARKFAGRHRALVGGIAAVFVVLLTGIAATAWQAQRVSQQRDLAAEQATRANETASLLSRMILAVTPANARGHEPTMRQMLQEFSLEMRADNSIHPMVAGDTNRTLARAYWSLGEFELAEQHAKHAIELHSQLSGSDSLDTLKDQMTLALILSRLDRDADAISMASRVLDRARLCPELTDETLIDMLNIRGYTLGADPNPDQAVVAQWYRKCHDLALRKFGPRHPRTLLAATNLGVTLHKLGQLDEAEQLLRHVYDTRKQTHGEDHPETILAAFNMSFLLLSKGDLNSAAELCRTNLKRAETVLGEDHPSTIRYRLKLANMEMKLGRAAAAEALTRVAFEDATQQMGPSHQDTIEARGLLVNILLAIGQTKEAETLALEQHQLCIKVFGLKHPHTVQAITLLFDLAEAHGDVAQMRKYAEQLTGTEWEKPSLEMVKQMEAKTATPH